VTDLGKPADLLSFEQLPGTNSDLLPFFFTRGNGREDNRGRKKGSRKRGTQSRGSRRGREGGSRGCREARKTGEASRQVHAEAPTLEQAAFGGFLSTRSLEKILPYLRARTESGGGRWKRAGRGWVRDEKTEVVLPFAPPVGRSVGRSGLVRQRTGETSNWWPSLRDLLVFFFLAFFLAGVHSEWLPRLD